MPPSRTASPVPLANLPLIPAGPKTTTSHPLWRLMVVDWAPAGTVPSWKVTWEFPLRYWKATAVEGWSCRSVARIGRG